VNDKNYAAYFPIAKHQTAILAPIELMKPTRIGRISLRVHGGGVSAQVSAVRNAIAKAIALQAPDAKKRLRRAGFITRDARMVERKKYGLKKARRAPQWQKR
jgi:small subunit ribosomal protein S9